MQSIIICDNYNIFIFNFDDFFISVQILNDWSAIFISVWYLRVLKILSRTIHFVKYFWVSKD